VSRRRLSSQQMKVLVIMPSATPHGGAEAALMHLVQSRGASGLDLHVCFLEEGPMRDLMAKEGVEVSCFQAGRLREPWVFLKTLRGLRRIIRRDRPDVVLGWMTKAHIFGGLAAIGTPSAAVYFQMGLPDGGVVDRLSRMVPAMGALGCSEFVAREQAALVKYPVVGVPLAADVSTSAQNVSTPQMKERLGFDPNRPLVGIVGRLQRWKGMHVYLRAMADVVRRHPDVQGVIVGGRPDLEPEYLAFLEGIRRDERLESVVRMVGKQANVPEWMQAMDVVVHASEREPFGIVVVEAMAMQKPVVATKPGGPEEIITHGVDGLLAPSGDAEQLAIAIQSLIEDPSLAASVAAAAKKRAADFTTAAYAANIGRAMRGLVDVNRGSNGFHQENA